MSEEASTAPVEQAAAPTEPVQASAVDKVAEEIAKQEAPPAEEANETTPAASNVPGFVTGEGSWDEDTLLALPDDLGKHSIFEKYKSVADLAKAAINKDKFIGQKVEEWIASEEPDIVKKRNEKLGVPNTPEEYVYDIPEGFDELPEEIRNRTLSYIEKQRGFAQEIGISKKQFQSVINKDLSEAIEGHKEATRQQEESVRNAEVELRKALPGTKYDDGIEKVENFYDALGLGFVKDLIKDKPAIILESLKAAEKIADDDIIEANQRESMDTVGESFDDLTDKIIMWRGSPNDPQVKQWQKQREALINKMKPRE